MARTQIEVNLLFCTDALPPKIIISKRENKVTVVNGLALDQAPPWGKREKKIEPVFCFFFPTTAEPDPRLLMVKSRALNIKAAYCKKASLKHCITF